MENEARRLELSTKLNQMGDSLMKEGEATQDKNVTQVGTFMTFISSLMLMDDDMRQFTELADMFSAKKIIDSMMGIKRQTYSPAVEERIKKSTETFSENLKLFSKKKRRTKKNGNDGAGETPETPEA